MNWFINSRFFTEPGSLHQVFSLLLRVDSLMLCTISEGEQDTSTVKLRELLTCNVEHAFPHRECYASNRRHNCE